VASFAGLSRRPKKLRPIPARAGDGERGLDEAWIGLSIPGKPVGENRYLLHLPVPFAAQYGAWLDLHDTPPLIDRALSDLFGRLRSVEQPVALGVQVAQLIGLKPIRQYAVQKVTGQVGGRLLPEQRMPTGSKRTDVEFTQARELDIECFTVRRCGSDPDACHCGV
jgi:hypothetical protein